VQNGVHEVARSVACKGTTGAIGPVSARGEAQDEDPGLGVAKAGNGTGPVGLVLVGAAFGFADAAAVVAKTRAALTGDDGLMNLQEELRRSLCIRGCHCLP